MKKSKNSAKNKMKPDPSALAGIPEQHPHEDNARFDANFKKSRGGTPK